MNSMDQGNAGLQGSWTHSHEEDEAGAVQVYRPTHSFAFPPSRRGRESLEFGSGGLVEQSTPGPDDRPRASAAGVTALGMNRYSLGGSAAAPGKVIEVIEMTPERLKLRLV